MTDMPTEVAVYAEDGRSSLLGTLHGWQKREDGWYGDVMVYGDYDPAVGSGMHRETVPADRLVPLVYCPHNPIDRKTWHTDACRDQSLDRVTPQP